MLERRGFRPKSVTENDVTKRAKNSSRQIISQRRCSGVIRKLEGSLLHEHPHYDIRNLRQKGLVV